MHGQCWYCHQNKAGPLLYIYSTSFSISLRNGFTAAVLLLKPPCFGYIYSNSYRSETAASERKTHPLGLLHFYKKN
jgi:hypothetical protein